MASSDFKREMEEEIKRRVEIIEAEDYDLGVPFSKGNWALVWTLFAIAIVLVGAGFFLV